jgi:peptide deformylase
MQIVKYPDPILRRTTETVTAFDGELEKIARQMLETMYTLRGVGLAAPQVGLATALLVLNPTGDPSDTGEELVLVNPEIISRKRLEWGEEGCLSFPDIYAEIERHREIELRYQDLQGEAREMRASEFEARVILHEMDHLQGILFIDRLSPADKIRLRSKLQDMERIYRTGA